jgi:serine/threonine protein kinase
MIQQAETRLNLTPGLLRSIEDGKLGLLKTREQFRDWRYYVQRGFILREVKKFVERVMKIDPKERPSAATLLEDEWLKDI